MIGITPDKSTLIGKNDWFELPKDCPLMAVCEYNTFNRYSLVSRKATNAIVMAITTTQVNTANGVVISFFKENTIFCICVGNDEAILIKISNDTPFPNPFSVIVSPIAIAIAVPIACNIAITTYTYHESLDNSPYVFSRAIVVTKEDINAAIIPKNIVIFFYLFTTACLF